MSIKDISDAELWKLIEQFLGTAETKGLAKIHPDLGVLSEKDKVFLLFCYFLQDKEGIKGLLQERGLQRLYDGVESVLLDWLRKLRIFVEKQPICEKKEEIKLNSEQYPPGEIYSNTKDIKKLEPGRMAGLTKAEWEVYRRWNQSGRIKN